MNIGITIDNSGNENNRLFCNGIMQNALHLYNLLSQTNNVYFICRGRNSNFKEYNTYTFEEGLEKQLNVLLQVGMTISLQERKLYKDQGCKIILIKYGSEMYSIMEHMIYYKSVNGIRSLTQHNDAVMISPHFEYSKTFLKQYLKCEVYTAPYLWEPTLLTRFRVFEKDEYQQKPNIVVMEPNIQWIKNCLIPLATVDKLYHEDSDSFNELFVYNAIEIGTSNYYKANILPFFPVLHSTNNKTTFFGRHKITRVFDKPDILLSFCDNCDLNYLHCEALYMGVPLVHNSKMLRDENVGFYYTDYNIDEAVNAIKSAMTYAQNYDTHTENNKKYLQKLSIYNKSNLDGYMKVISNVC